MNSVHAALPHLGSQLLKFSEKHAHANTAANYESAAIDDIALNGGFNYGQLTSIAGSSGTGKSTVAYHVIASHLLDELSGDVILVDSNGSFSADYLRAITAARLRQKYSRGYRQRGYMYEGTQRGLPGEKNDALEEATVLLEKVKIMSIFNFAGMVEVVGEIAEALEKSKENVDVASLEPGPMVADSDEEADLSHNPDLHKGRNEAVDSRSASYGIGMLVIDAITSVAGPLVAKDYIQGQALLANLVRSLRLMTATYRLCTILVNSSSSPRAALSGRRAVRDTAEPSIFSSMSGRPALGKPYALTVDFSILLFRYGKTQEPAPMMYVDEKEKVVGEEVCVMEVLSDRTGPCEGRWCVLEFSGDHELRSRKPV